MFGGLSWESITQGEFQIHSQDKAEPLTGFEQKDVLRLAMLSVSLERGKMSSGAGLQVERSWGSDYANGGGEKQLEPRCILDIRVRGLSVDLDVRGGKGESQSCIVAF